MESKRSDRAAFLHETFEAAGFARVGGSGAGRRGHPGLWGPVGRDEVAAWAARLPPGTDARYGTSAAAGAVACALAYADSGEVDPLEEPPAASVGRFARDDSYGELAARLANVRDALRARYGWPKSAVRVLVNSGAPEKPLAVLAGLGPVGRNTLVLSRGLGPGVVLGALLLPFDPSAESVDGGPLVGGARSEEADFEPGARCGTCRACVDACPTGAVLAGGGIDAALCAQAAASSEAEVPPGVAVAWPSILYGCDHCLTACPLFVRASPGWQGGTEARTTGPGRSVRLDFLLGASDGELAAAFRGTALGLGWMKPSLWRRNAALAAASRTRGV